MTAPEKYDLAVIGSGILGMAHAWHAHRAGLNTIVFDRTGRPQGASIRNFGMLWPLGQKAGEDHSVDAKYFPPSGATRA